MRLCLVAGARPNFMKVAPIVHALRARGHNDWFLVHTGQHYDAKLSAVFFEELGLPDPDVWLGVGSGTHAEQTTRQRVDHLERLQLEIATGAGDGASAAPAGAVGRRRGRIAGAGGPLRAGLPGAVDGMAVSSLAEFYAALEDNKPGDRVVVEYYRGSKKVSVEVVLSDRAAARN